MYWKRTALAAGVAVIAVACTTVEGAPPGSGIEGVMTSTANQVGVPQTQPGGVTDTQRDPSAATVTTEVGQTTTTVSEFEPVATTVTTIATIEMATDSTTTITTEAVTATAPSNDDIEALLDTLDDLLSDLDGQLDGLDNAVDESANSLTQDEGDIGQ